MDDVVRITEEEPGEDGSTLGQANGESIFRIDRDAELVADRDVSLFPERATSGRESRPTHHERASGTSTAAGEIDRRGRTETDTGERADTEADQHPRGPGRSRRSPHRARPRPAGPAGRIGERDLGLRRGRWRAGTTYGSARNERPARTERTGDGSIQAANREAPSRSATMTAVTATTGVSMHQDRARDENEERHGDVRGRPEKCELDEIGRASHR